MGCDEWTPDDDMRRYIRNANGLLDHWGNESWLSWATPVALMPVTRSIVRQRQEEEAAQRACEEAQWVIEAARHEEERWAKEVTAKKRTAVPVQTID